MHRPARMIERITGAWLLTLALLVFGGTAAWAQPVTPADVSHMDVSRTDEGVLLSATVRFDLPPVVDDALSKGIPMYFVAEASIFRDRWYWTDKRVATATRHFRLAYQPLTRRWRLQASASPIGTAGLVLGQNFDTREEALASLQRISGWRIADANALDTDTMHTVDFRFRLDVSQLPRPFQIGAVGQADWFILATRTLRITPEHQR